jgi:uncharacterized Zn finger protein (UPF0148 family)
MKTCPKCGYDKNEEDALFCNLCHEIFVKKKKEEIEKKKEPPLHFEDLPPEVKEKLLSISKPVEERRIGVFSRRLFFGILIIMLVFIIGFIIWAIISYLTFITHMMR